MNNNQLVQQCFVSAVPGDKSCKTDILNCCSNANNAGVYQQCFDNVNSYCAPTTTSGPITTRTPLPSNNKLVQQCFASAVPGNNSCKTDILNCCRNTNNAGVYQQCFDNVNSYCAPTTTSGPTTTRSPLPSNNKLVQQCFASAVPGNNSCKTDILNCCRNTNNAGVYQQCFDNVNSYCAPTTTSGPITTHVPLPSNNELAQKCFASGVPGNKLCKTNILNCCSNTNNAGVYQQCFDNVNSYCDKFIGI